MPTLSFADMEISRVEETVLPVPMTLLAADPALVARHRGWLAPRFMSEDEMTFWLYFQTWLLRADGLTIVVDPCNGNGRDRPAMPQFHQLNTPFIERFEATGVRPDQVDIVFCTHLHCDHCGWNTQLRGGRWVPTFPNARYLFLRREAERWDPRRPGHVEVDYNRGVFEDSVLPVIEAGLAELVEEHHQFHPGFSIEPAYGHTKGHAIVRIATPQTRLYMTGDSFHHPLQVSDPALHLGGCDDLPATIATRERLRRTIAREEAVMIPAHFPAPHGGRIVEDGSAWRFVPLGDDA